MTQTRGPRRETVFARIIVATNEILFRFMRRFPSITLLLVFSAGPGIAIVHGGELITHHFDSQKLAGNLMGESPTREFVVYLPDGYNESDEQYPVVYWFPANWVEPVAPGLPAAIDEAIQSGRIPPTIIAFMARRTQTFGSTLFLSSDAFGDWEGFLTSEVIPFVDDTYRTYGTSQQRGIMGFEIGGLPALMLPLLHPDTWGAVGANNPMSWYIASSVRDWPEPAVFEGSRVDNDFRTMPTSLQGYTTTSRIEHQIYGQLGARFSPNPDSPVFADFPRDRQGQWVPDAREKWRALDIFDPNIVPNHMDALQDLSMVSIIEKDTDCWFCGAEFDREFIETIQAAGINAKHTIGVGNRWNQHNERFVALLEDLSGGMASSLTWDENGPGNWDDHRWVGPLDYPTGGARVVARSDALTVANDASASMLKIDQGGRIVINAGNTLTVTDAVNLTAEATLRVDGTLTAGSVAAGGTLTGSGTLHATAIQVMGTVAPGGSSTGTLTVGSGEMELTAASTYEAQVSLAANEADVIEVSNGGSLQLGGTLVLSAINRTGADSWAVAANRRIVNSPAGAVVDAGFTVTPPPADDATSHIGQGAFLRAVHRSPAGVELDLFIALGGDADGNGKVWLEDWAALRANFGNTGTEKTWTDGNFDPWEDDKVWLSDWAALRATFGNSDYTATEGAAAAVPEPPTLALLLAGLAGLFEYARRKR